MSIEISRAKKAMQRFMDYVGWSANRWETIAGAGDGVVAKYLKTPSRGITTTSLNTLAAGATRELGRPVAVAVFQDEQALDLWIEEGLLRSDGKGSMDIGRQLEPEAPPPSTPVRAINPPAAGERPDVPVWASAEAESEGAMVLTPEPIDYIRRSERMQGVRNPFAFYVIGASMSPAVEHGDQVVINPAIPPRPGVDCVFLQDQPDGSQLALVKRLVCARPNAWEVRQFNEPRDFELPRNLWKRALYVAEIRRSP